MDNANVVYVLENATSETTRRITEMSLRDACHEYAESFHEWCSPRGIAPTYTRRGNKLFNQDRLISAYSCSREAEYRLLEIYERILFNDMQNTMSDVPIFFVDFDDMINLINETITQ